MALRINDNLERLFNPITINNRIAHWLWHWLNHRNINPDTHTEASPKLNLRNRLELVFKENLSLLNEAKQEHSVSIIPDSKLEWLNEGERLETWIKPIITTYTQLPLYIGSAPDKDKIILNIDLWGTNTLQKMKTLEILKAAWATQKSKDKMYKWFFDDTEKCKLASDWLTNNITGFMKPLKAFEKTEDLIIYFETSLINEDIIKYHISQIRKRWSQNKYRETNKEKSQKNFLLSNKATKKLAQLSNKYGISQSRTIEILIEMESKNNSHIPQKIETSKLLSSKYDEPVNAKENASEHSETNKDSRADLHIDAVNFDEIL